MRNALLLSLALLCLPACRVMGPAYRRPAVDVPAAHRDADPGSGATLADLPWWEVFQDPALHALVAEAIEANQDLRLALARVDEARATVGIPASEGRPQVSLEADLARTRRSEAASGGPLTDRDVTAHSLAIGASWELDLWGRIRRSTEAAWAEYLATEEGRRAVLVALVGDVAQAYLELLALDWQLEVTRRTAETRERTRGLFQRRLEGGVGSELEVSRAAGDLAGAAAAIPEIQLLIAKKEHQLSLLLGRVPGPIARGVALDALADAPLVPVGLPVDLLERRPDLREAEQQVRAAVALVGVARAERYPRLSLTAALGLDSPSLDDLVSDEAVFGSLGAGLLAPLLTGGLLDAQECVARARWRQAEATWIKAVQSALRDVADALVEVRRTREVSAQLVEQVRMRQRALALATQRFEGELASYFEVLDAQRELFPAELQLAAAKREEHVAVVRLYRALGGGWERPAPPAPPAPSSPPPPPPPPPPGGAAPSAAPPAGPLPAQPAVPAPR